MDNKFADRKQDMTRRKRLTLKHINRLRKQREVHNAEHANRIKRIRNIYAGGGPEAPPGGMGGLM